MPRRKPLLTSASWRRSRWDEWDERRPVRRAPAKRARRVAGTSVLVVAFAFGAALSAGAGETVATMMDSTESAVPVTSLPPEDALQAMEPAVADEVTEQTEPAAETAPPEQAEAPTAPPAGQPPAEPEVVSEPAPATTEPAPAPAAETPPVPPAPSEAEPTITPAPTVEIAEQPRKAQPRRQRKPAARAKAKASWRPQAEPVLRTRTRPRDLGSQLEPEARVPGVDATVWLHRALPDPTPPSKRLSRSFAHHLRTVGREAKVDWALLLGLLRAQGRTDATPATLAELSMLAARVGSLRGHEEHAIALALAGNEENADRAVALAHYHRAVGLRALVRGLEWAKPRLEQRLLRDDRIATYEGGRFDIESGLVDVRVLVLIAYLADTYGEVTVSSLKTGHRLYSRPGVVSAHVYGLAVDIAALGGVSIQGNQEPGGLTEDAVRNILLLPSEVLPRQVISLLGLGGPSFPMGDHGDHIHVGY
jgi:hypothetical protein